MATIEDLSRLLVRIRKEHERLACRFEHPLGTVQVKHNGTWHAVDVAHRKILDCGFLGDVECVAAVVSPAQQCRGVRTRLVEEIEVVVEYLKLIGRVVDRHRLGCERFVADDGHWFTTASGLRVPRSVSDVSVLPASNRCDPVVASCPNAMEARLMAVEPALHSLNHEVDRFVDRLGLSMGPDRAAGGGHRRLGGRLRRSGVVGIIGESDLDVGDRLSAVRPDSIQFLSAMHKGTLGNLASGRFLESRGVLDCHGDHLRLVAGLHL